MIRQPEFRTCFQVQIGSDQVFLIAGGETVTLHGHLYSLLVPQIDGRNTARQIARNLRNDMSPVHVYYGLSLLEKRGLIRETSRLDEQAVRVSDLLATDPLSFARKLQETTVSVRSFSWLPAEELLSILAGTKVKTGEEGDFTIVLVDDYLQGELEDFNGAALRSGKPWMLVGTVGGCAWIGPIFRPGRPGCWACLRHRMTQNRPELSGIGEKTGSDARISERRRGLPAAVSLALDLAAVQTLRWLTTGKSILDGRLMTLNTISLLLEEHCLICRPRCPACGRGPETRKPATGSADICSTPDWQRAHPPIVLAPRGRFSARTSGYRIQAPETTLGALRHHLSPITGIVGPLVPLFEKEDELLNVYTTDPERTGRDTRFKSPAFGKGGTPIQAQVSAICESLERYSALYHGDEQRRTASYGSLGDTAIHPNRCMLFSDAQYENRQGWNSRQRLQWVPNRLDEKAEIHWSPVWSLGGEVWRYLPTSYCYLGYPATSETACCVADSNGVAAGNCMEEAILQGFFELVERDSVAIWWYNRATRAELDLQSFQTPYLSSLQHYYSTRGRKLWVLDVTTDLGIPAFAAVSERDKPGDGEFIFGFGAHFDPEIAISRALTEMNQWLALSLMRGFADVIQPHGPASDSDRSWLRPDPLIPARNRSSFQTYRSDDLTEDVRRCVGIAADHDLEVFVLDLTRPGLGLNVTRVIVPGLRPWWPRFAQGRLYEVPVRMGWRDNQSTESQLNDLHICF